MISLMSDALGYIDPGTGSLFLQAMVAGLLGAAFTIKTFWKNIAATAGRILGRDRNEPPQA